EDGLGRDSRLEPRGGETEQDAAVGIDGQLLQRRRLELARTRVPGLRPRAAAFGQRPDGERPDPGQGAEREDDEDEQPALPAARDPALAIEPALLPPAANRLGEDVVEDL